MRARTYEEMELYVAEHPCVTCGTAVALSDLRQTGTKLPAAQGSHLIFTGRCKSCKSPLTYEFDVPADWPDVPAFVYGADDPSELFTGDDWRRLAEREAAQVIDPPDGSVPSAYYASYQHLRAAVGMLREAAKSGGPRPDRLQALERLLDEYKRLLPEVNTRARAAQVDAPPKMRLNKETIAAHGRWLARGRSGLNQLIVEDDRLVGLPLGNLNLAAAKLTRVKLDSSRIDFGHFEDAVLVECSAEKTNFSRTVFDRARLERCFFDNAGLGLTDFKDGVVIDTSLYEANANRSMWHGIQLTRCNMRDMRIGDCVLDGAVLEDCDLRGANLGRIDDGLPLCTTKGTIFRRCDLRGAHLDGRRLDGTKFIDCKLAGVNGKPAIEGSYSVEGGDTPMAEIVKLWGPPR